MASLLSNERLISSFISSWSSSIDSAMVAVDEIRRRTGYERGNQKWNFPLKRGIRVNTMPRENDSRYKLSGALYLPKNTMFMWYKSSSLIGQVLIVSYNI
jgi:hypothetical protein